jgi:hypothetical protein
MLCRKDGGHPDGHVEAGVVGLVADAIAAELVDVVEEVEEPLQPGGRIRRGRLPESVEQVGRHPLGVIRRLREVRRDRSDQHRPVDLGRPVRAQVPGDLAGPHGVADERNAVQAERVDQRVQVGGEGVPVVAAGGLAGLARAAAVIGDDPVPGREQRRNLLVPGPAAERVAVDENHRRAAAVVLVVEVDGA